MSESIKEMTEAAVQEVKETEVELRARMAGARAARTVRHDAAKAERKVRRKVTAAKIRGKVKGAEILGKAAVDKVKRKVAVAVAKRKVVHAKKAAVAKVRAAATKARRKLSRRG